LSGHDLCKGYATVPKSIEFYRQSGLAICGNRFFGCCRCRLNRCKHNSSARNGENDAQRATIEHRTSKHTRDRPALVDEYLRLLMIPDPDAARRMVAADLAIRFTGGRATRDPAECSRFNATRYN
jgi:hypothetical protein